MRIPPPIRPSPSVRAAQVEGLYRSALAAVAGQFFGAILVIATFWDAVPRGLLLSWLGVMIGVLGMRLVLALLFMRRASDQAAVDGWRWCLIAMIGCAGLVWGAAGAVLFVSDSFIQQILLVLVLLVVAVGSMAFTATYDIASYYVFAVSVMCPIIIRLLMEQDARHTVIGLGLFALMGAFLGYGRSLYQKITESLEIREHLKVQHAAAEQARADAEAANRAKSRFLAAASHDLRQPLHALALFAAALRGQVSSTDAIRLVDRVNASVEAMDGLFSALLDISKLDAGVLAPRIEALRLAPLLARMVADYQPEASLKGIVLEVGLCENVILQSDGALLERVLRNLLSNAVRYTAEGRVGVQCAVHGEKAKIAVSDTGIGIPADKLEDIFLEFYQVRNPERDRSKGLGLGLAIVKRICDLLGHRIEVVSQLAQGSTFTVEVPLGKESEILQEVFPRSAPIAGLVGAFIVVVDDEADVRAGMQALLSDWGCNALTAGSGEEAVRELANHERAPDVLISDYRLREGETGIDAIALLQHALGEAVPGILITGDTSPERLQEAAATGYHLLHKPVSPARLRELLTRLVDDVTTAREHYLDHASV